MNLPKIIGVSAPSRRSGKGTVADVLITEFGYTQFNYAAPIKTMFISLCMSAGIPQEMYPRMLNGDLKETPIQELGGLSFRTFAEGVGTTWGRNMVSLDLWVNIARSQITKLLREKKRLVIEDARFSNECDLIKELGGVVIKVVRPVFNGGLKPTLASEGHLESYPFDFIFANDRDVASLQEKVRTWMLGTGAVGLKLR